MREPYVFLPLTVAMTSLIAVDDIAQVTIPMIEDGSAVIGLDSDWSVSVRALVSGTATLIVKRGDGTTIASRAITGAGCFTFRPTVSTITMGDKLRFGFSGVGVGLADVVVMAWLKMPSTM